KTFAHLHLRQEPVGMGEKCPIICIDCIENSDGSQVHRIHPFARVYHLLDESKEIPGLQKESPFPQDTAPSQNTGGSYPSICSCILPESATKYPSVSLQRLQGSGPQSHVYPA